MNNWIQTDDDQYTKCISKGVYRLAEVRETLIGSGVSAFYFVSDVIDLDTWPVDAIDDIVKAYYPDGMKELEEDVHNDEERSQIIAECIFEQSPYVVPSETYATFEEALEAMKSKILTN